MLIEQESSTFRILNNFSRQLFLIKTPSDFSAILISAFKNVFPEIELFAFIRYNWEENTFSIISSNYLNDFSDLKFDKIKFEELLNEFIKNKKSIYNNKISYHREGGILPLINAANSGSELISPLIPVNEAVGILYTYAKKSDFFDKEIIEAVKLVGNMTSRSWNLINFQAQQIKSHKKAERAVINQKVFYQQIFNTVPNYIYVKDRDGNFLLTNKAVSELFNLTQEQILSLGITNSSEIKVNELLNQQKDQEVLETKKSIEYEESIVLKNGEKRWYHTTKMPLPGKDGVVNVFGISIDITERKNYSDELIKAKQAKEQFLANMSHEIRTPINGIVGMLNLLEEIPATEEQKKYLNAIKTSSGNLQVIINDILDLSAVESGNIKFEKIGFNLQSFFNSLISSFSYAAKQKGISITLNFDPYIDKVIIGDPVRLNQIISNLIGNAVKFTKRGYVKVYALKISEENNLGNFQFIVDDSGIGIPENKIQKVFENFEQGDATVNRKFGGTGLGLSIVKQLVEVQGGSIDVQSKSGRGTKFIINLKFEIGTENETNEQESTISKYEESTNTIDLSKSKVLVVEDNKVNLLYTRKILQNWNCIPDEATNGLIALERLKEKEYDLILMDVRMPTMDGFEATKFIRTNFEPPKCNTPIIALTANAIKGDEDKCLQAGMNDYISKPFQPETLKNKIIGNMDLEGFTKKVGSKTKTEVNQNKIIDLTYLKEMSDNEVDFIIDMINSFISQSPKDIENIWFHFSNNNLDDVANLIHKIKPSISFMGIHELKELVLEIEDNARHKKIVPLKDQLEKFDKICQNAIIELREEIIRLKNN